MALAALQTVTGTFLTDAETETRRSGAGWPRVIVAAGALTALPGEAPRKKPRRSSPSTWRPVLSSEIQRTVRADALLYPLQQAAIAPKISAPIKTVLCGARRARARRPAARRAREARIWRAPRRRAQAAYRARARRTTRPPRRATRAAGEPESGARRARRPRTRSMRSRRSSTTASALFKEGAIAQKDVNDAQVDLSQARNQYEIARKRLEDLQGFGGDQALKARRRAARCGARAHTTRRRRSSATPGSPARSTAS